MRAYVRTQGRSSACKARGLQVDYDSRSSFFFTVRRHGCVDQEARAWRVYYSQTIDTKLSVLTCETKERYYCFQYSVAATSQPRTSGGVSFIVVGGEKERQRGGKKEAFVLLIVFFLFLGATRRLFEVWSVLFDYLFFLLFSLFLLFFLFLRVRNVFFIFYFRASLRLSPSFPPSPPIETTTQREAQSLFFFMAES